MTKGQAINKLRKSGFFHSEPSTIGWVEEAFKHTPQLKKAKLEDLSIEKIGEETVEIKLWDGFFWLKLDEFIILEDVKHD